LSSASQNFLLQESGRKQRKKTGKISTPDVPSFFAGVKTCTGISEPGGDEVAACDIFSMTYKAEVG
jgi:hypothetical protein